MKFTFSIRGSSKKELLIKLLLYSAIYGFFHVNYIDLLAASLDFPAYHLWIICLYFAPFIPLLFVYDFKNWEIVLSVGFLASLMNDLGYYPAGMLLFGRTYDLLAFYKFQLGFEGLKVGWYANFGFVKIPVSSLLMAFTIYVRVLFTFVLVVYWWRKNVFRKWKMSERIIY